MHLILAIPVLSALFVTRVSANSDSYCVTYKGTRGTCVNIKECPFLLNLLKHRKSLPQSSLLRLNKSHCGFEGFEPKVCCSNELSDDEKSPTSQSIASTTSLPKPMSNSSKQTACKTGSGREGTCLSVEQCPSLYAILRQDKMVGETSLQILKESLCGFEKMIPKVCCSDDRLPTVESTTISQSHQTISNELKPEKCVTPQGADGTCVNLKHCQSLFRLLKRSNQFSYEVSQTLMKANCGFEKMDPKVCCENEKRSPMSSPGLQQTDEEQIPTPPDVRNHPSLELLEHDICGPIPEAKIIGGTKTTVFEFPWMALIAYDTGADLPEFRCGGSLITKKHVVTAAHCVTTLPPDLHLAGVRLGEHDLSEERDCDRDINGFDINCAEDYQDFSILGIAAHPNYPKDKHQDDIALIMLDGEANFGAANVRPICLPVGLTSVSNSRMTVTGWGATDTGPRSETLRKVTLPIVPYQECARLYKMRKIKIWYKQICAGGSNRTDSCSGDSGGPLQTVGMYNKQPRNILYGIVSFGPRDCGSDLIPGVYTRVEYYMDWILDTIGVDMYDD